MKISVFYNDKTDSEMYVQQIKELLNSLGAEIRICSKSCEDKTAESAAEYSDIVLVLGGDGTIMRYSKLAAKFNKPILGINRGRLGFLAGLEENDINKLKNLVTGEYKIVKRMIICAESSDASEPIFALNDIVVSRCSDFPITDFKVIRNNKPICNFRADGIIAATPTGSTAYSLSAGGPIVESDMQCIILTPVCPHSLSARPLILNSNGEVKIEFTPRKNSEIVVMVDGQLFSKHRKAGSLKVSCSDEYVSMITMSDDDFYKNIDKKLIGKDLYWR